MPVFFYYFFVDNVGVQIFYMIIHGAMFDYIEIFFIDY